MKNSNFAKLRKTAGYITQEQLAKRLDIDRSTVAKWESGKALPRAKTLRRLAAALGCQIDELIDDTDGSK